MKKGAFIIVLSVIVSINISWQYNQYKLDLYEQPPHFDLFIAHSIDQLSDNLSVNGFWNHIWDKKSQKNKRPIEWIYDLEEFEKLDSIYLGFKNISNEKFYYLSWGEPNSRIRVSFNIFRNGKIDTIPFGGFGCATGVFLTPIKQNETSGSKLLNPLLRNPYTNLTLVLNSDKFPEVFRKIYGDSVAINFKQATYGLPWNKFPTQIIESNEIIISTEKVITNWRNGEMENLLSLEVNSTL